MVIKKKNAKKGFPPAENDVNKNLESLSSTELVALNFKVSLEFKEAFKDKAHNKKITMVDMLKRMFESY